MLGYIIAIVIGCVILFLFGRDIIRGLSSRNWPTTEGKITQSGVDMSQSTDDEGEIKTSYGASIQYTYSVSWQELVGSRRTFTNVRTNSSRRAEQIVERYPQGSSVTVYYTEEDPSLSVLEPGVGWFSYVGMVLVLGLIIVGILGVTGVIG